MALVVAGAAGLLFASGEPLYDELWTALAGAGIDWQFAGEKHRTTPERIVAALISVGGMLVTALMLGIVSDAIGSRMDELRKGRSEVLETGHTLILGWSDKCAPTVPNARTLLCRDLECPELSALSWTRLQAAAAGARASAGARRRRGTYGRPCPRRATL